MQGTMKKMCCLGICLLFCFTAGCKEKETLTLEEVTKVNTEESRKENTKENGEKEAVKEKGQTEITEEKLYVYVCGEVKSPGVYELEPGSRIYEAVRAAGGMTEAADEYYLNQAEVLNDGQQIYVPSKEEIEAEEKILGKPEEIKEEGSKKVNLNTASKEELMTLTGIGEAKADSIIRYREENGGFQNPEDLMKIEGIKSGVFNKIKEQITV